MEFYKSLLAVGLIAGLMFGCGNQNDAENPVEAPGNEGTSEPSPEPFPAPDSSVFTEIRLIMAYSGDDGCSQEFFVDQEGQWNYNRCRQHQISGHLTEQELKALASKVAAATEQTQPTSCPEVIRLDAYYVDIQSGRGTLSYDPENACFDGGEAQVQSLRNHLIRLKKNKT